MGQETASEESVGQEAASKESVGGLTAGAVPQDSHLDDNGQEVSSNVGKDTAAKTIQAPENLANKDLWDSEKGQLKTEDVLNELATQSKRVEDLRKKLSKGADLPKEAKEYEITPSDGLSDVIDTKAEIFEGIKDIAFKNNMTKDQLNGFVNDYMQLCLDSGLISKPLNEEERKSAKDTYVAAQKKMLGSNAESQIQSAVSFIEAEHRKGVFDEAEKKELMAFADKGAAGIRIINKIRELSGQPFVPVENAQHDGLAPDREIIKNWGEYSDSEKINILEQRQKLGRPSKFME